jgi:hypothetical protein
MTALTDRLRVRGAAVVLVSLALLTWTDGASAKKKPPQPADVAALAQYRESISTASGQTLAGAGAATTRPLDPALRLRIQRGAGKRAELLERIAGSSLYGAPQSTLRGPLPAGDRAGVGSALASVPLRLLLALAGITVALGAIGVFGPGAEGRRSSPAVKTR